MKTLRILLLVVLSTAFLFSCEGDEGPQGLQGETGATGPQGVAGNADVIIWTYGSKTFTSHTSFAMIGMSASRIDSCMVLAYYRVGSNWYSVPGIGDNAFYQTRNYWYSTGMETCTMDVYLYTLTGTAYSTSVTWTKFKIYVVSPSVIYTGKKGGPMDLSTPNDIDEYLNPLKE